jgi:hypothetical protein
MIMSITMLMCKHVPMLRYADLKHWPKLKNSVWQPCAFNTRTWEKGNNKNLLILLEKTMNGFVIFVYFYMKLREKVFFFSLCIHAFWTNIRWLRSAGPLLGSQQYHQIPLPSLNIFNNKPLPLDMEEISLDIPLLTSMTYAMSWQTY